MMFQPVILMALLLVHQLAVMEVISERQPNTIDQLKWMAGAWAGEEEGVEMEEVWTSPKGGVMLGLHRDVFGSGKVFFEFLRIQETPEAVTFFASPAGREPTPFEMVECSDQKVVFENPEHDYPQRIMYWLDVERRLHARIAGMEKGKSKESEWVWSPSDSSESDR